MNTAKILYKWVKKAQLYCKTTFVTGKKGQRQTWLTKEEYNEEKK